MSTPRKIRAIPRLMQHLIQTPRTLMKDLMRWVMRVLLLIGRQPQAGFVLPTTALLLLVVTLTVGAIGYRTFIRTQETIGERQQQVIYNAATPAIDRARAKLEFLFDPNRDPRAGGVPNQRQLLGMMLNDGRAIDGAPGPQRFPATGPDPYTLPGEERLDLDGDTKWDNAWKYPADTNGDGQADATVVYSILMTAPPNNRTGNPANPLQDSRLPALTTRAERLQVRNAPLSNTNQLNLLCQRSSGGAAGLSLVNGDGWFPDPNNRTKLRKNFQVNAYVVPNSQNGTVTTLEFQQDREATQGFKWAAWFRNDIEIFPGADFNWNGAMHTEGSFILGGKQNERRFRSYLVSSPNSCIFDKSELTVAKKEVDGAEIFAGQFIVGIARDNTSDGQIAIDVGLTPQTQNRTLTKDNDSVKLNAVSPAATTTDFALEPVVLQTQDESRSRGSGFIADASFRAGNPQRAADTGWGNSEFNSNGQGRLLQTPQPTPYLDDIFRADNRLGPEPKVGRDARRVEQINSQGIGQPISTARQDLISDAPASGAANSEVGLDGYWERRSRLEGLRLVVGQRLELGDPAGWGGPTDASGASMGNATLGAATEPLRPWAGGCTGNNRCNERRQRRSLLDNLPAVQATAVYHANAATGGDFPLACLATTVHPGTAGTLDKSSTFENLAAPLPRTAIPDYTDQANPMVISDFFRGRGTNGWEFETHLPTEFTTSSSALMTALRNLANFAGDPLGGAPSFPPETARSGQGEVHPYPSMAMWGDFSVLRRVLDERYGGGYANLSPADKSTLHTAACTLGMLAYNIDYLEKLDYATLESPPPGTPPGTPSLLGSAALPGTGSRPAGFTGSTDREFIQYLGSMSLADLRAYLNGLTSPAQQAEFRQYFSGLRGRLRLIDLMIDTVESLTTPKSTVSDDKAREINNTIRTLTPSSAPSLALPNPGTSGSRILLDLARMLDANRQLMVATDRNNNPEFYVRLLERWRDDPGTDAATRLALQNDIYLAQLIITKEQVARDRQFGFLGAYGNNATESNATRDVLAQNPLGRCYDWNTSSDSLVKLCSMRPRYPILYSLFPAKLSLNPITGNPSLAPTVAAAYDRAGNDDFQPHRDYEEDGDLVNNDRVRDAEDRSPPSLTSSNYLSRRNRVTYQVVRPQDVALRPRRLAALGGAIRDRGGSGAVVMQDWLLPFSDGTTTAFTPNGNDRNRIKVCSAASCSYPADRSGQGNYPRPLIGTIFNVPFKDHAFFDGREMMTVRTLDLDLDMLRNSNKSLTNNDYWLPKEGIVYAFREDAVSEANIVRPTAAAASWANCDTEAKMQSTEACQMNTYNNAYASIDPPLNAANRITPKPVDYLADPDRRPHGFRLKQGASLVRGGSANNETKSVGISFISANPAFILGDFNLHRAFSGNSDPIEEFTVRLAEDYSNFYTRGNGGSNGDLEQNFAQLTRDQWRPSEVLADAITILSSSFCDGSIEDTMATAGSDDGAQVRNGLQNRYGCNNRQTSFLNQDRPLVNPNSTVNTQTQSRWVTTNIADSYPPILRNTSAGSTNPDIGDSPLLISRSGMPVQWDSVSTFRDYRTADGFYRTNQKRALNQPTNNTRVNTILVSGITPTRTNQPNGGLQNFPRFMEAWQGDNLFFAGAFLQLNFSSYATAPFDQDAWEQGASPVSGTGCTSGEDICYYEAPNRRWGYDPALQYVPPAPIAQRFQQPSSTRSEFYSEPAADDPYIQRLSQCVAPNRCRPTAG